MLSRKERLKEQNRNDILDAAERIFMRMGYHLATVELIAQEAEFAVGTLYNFFKNKQELYDQVMERVGDRFLYLMETEVLSKNDAEEALVALIDLILSQFDAYQGLLRDFLLMAPLSQLDPYCGMSEMCQEFYNKIILINSQLFQRGMRDGVFEKDDPDTLGVAFEGMTNGLMFSWARMESPPAVDEQRKIMVRMSNRLLGASIQ